MDRSRTGTPKHLLAAGLSRLVRRPRLTPEQLRELDPRGIVVVRQHNQMGDMVCATPALRAIRETWPSAEIVLVTAPVNVEVVQHSALVDRTLTFAQRMWRHPGRLLRFLRELRAGRPELAFVLSSVSFSMTSAAIALASGARWVVGADSRPFGWDISRHAFSLELPSQPLPDRHAVDHSLAPLEAVGITTADRTTEVRPAPAETEAARRLLDDLGVAPRFWALHPGAGKAQNVWPAAAFAEVARRAAAAGHDVIVLHGPADTDALDGLRRALARPPVPAVHVAPDLSVGAAAAVLARAERFLCNDTGIMHVAGALGVPTVALFGPTDPALWKPPGDHVTALRSTRQRADARGPEYGWMEDLDVDEVWRVWSGLPVQGNATG